ncbi:viral movement protein [Medicago truncatula]|uniref:Viral movement protein n=1 Tax=Medicago truncatula TaxID=3880 RepID=A0A072TUS8_MEDTR|nr:viral movement protein [Medicago truncatula]
MTEVSFFEGTSSYYVDDIIDNKIEESDLSLTAEENFKRKFNKFKEFFSRKNILKFGIMIEEEAISIENTQGNIFISTIQKTQIEKRIETFSEKEKSKSGYIHISTIQILIKSIFMKGIDSPLEIALEDSRILDKRQATIAQIQNKTSERVTAGKEHHHRLSIFRRSLRFSTGDPLSSQSIMTTSKRLAVRKVEKFEKNITKRGSVPETTVKKGNDYPQTNVLIVKSVEPRAELLLLRLFERFNRERERILGNGQRDLTIPDGIGAE